MCSAAVNEYIVDDPGLVADGHAHALPNCIIGSSGSENLCDHFGSETDVKNRPISVN